MATAVDKWPAYARLSAVAQAGHLPTAPTPPLGTRPTTGAAERQLIGRQSSGSCITTREPEQPRDDIQSWAGLAARSRPKNPRG